MSGRVDLERMRDRLRVYGAAAFTQLDIRDLLSHAAALERDLEAANQKLSAVKALEWSGDMFQVGGYCFMCGNLKSEGHLADCPLAAALARGGGAR